MKLMWKNLGVLASVAWIPLIAYPAGAQDSAVEKYIAGQGLRSGPPLVYRGKAITIRYSNFLPAAANIAKISIGMFERLKKDTNGKLIIKPYWANSLANASRGAFKAVSSGIADMGSCYSVQNPGGFNLVYAFQLPNLIPSGSVGARTLMEVYPKYLKAAYEKRDVYMIRAVTTPPSQALSRNKPLRKIADFKGLKIWASGKNARNMVKALGAAPVGLAGPSEFYAGFSRGVVDVFPIHDAALVLFRVYESGKYHIKMDLGANGLEFCINKKVYDGLPSDLRGIFYNWAQVWNQAEAQLYYDREAAKARAKMRQKGIEFIELSDAEKGKRAVVYAKMTNAWIQENEAAGRPAKALVAEIKAKVKRLAKLTNDQRAELAIKKPVQNIIASARAM